MPLGEHLTALSNTSASLGVMGIGVYALSGVAAQYKLSYICTHNAYVCTNNTYVGSKRYVH